MSESHNDYHVEGLIMRGITNNKGLGSKCKFKSKSKSRKITCLNVIKYDTLGRTVITKNIRKRRRKPLMLKILLVKGNFFMILKVFFLCPSVTRVIGGFFI